MMPLKFQRHLPPDCPPLGISQVSDFTFDARCSLSPRIARQLRLPVASLSILDFATFGRLVAITGVTRPNRIHLTLRLASLPERIPPPPITQRKRRRTTCQTGNLHDNLLTGHKLNHTYLAIHEGTEFADLRRMIKNCGNQYDLRHPCANDADFTDGHADDTVSVAFRQRAVINSHCSPAMSFFVASQVPPQAMTPFTVRYSPRLAGVMPPVGMNCTPV